MDKQKQKNNWQNLERGVPITDGANFVHFETESGFVHDDLGAYRHHLHCEIDYRREITWIAHDGSGKIPVNFNDKVLIETHDKHLNLMVARLIDWTSVARYRVIRKFPD